MELPYTDTDESVVDTYRRVHANSEQTHVAILSAGDSRYVAVAYDIDPVEMMPGAAECVAYDPTLEGVRERARRWMERNPRGVMGGESDDGGSSRVAGAVMKGLKKMNDYGNQQVEQMNEQQRQQGGQQ